MAPGGDYRVEAQACNASGCSAWSNAVTIKVRPAFITVTPARVPANTNFTASWDAANSPTSYNVKINTTVLSLTGTTWTGTPASLGMTPGQYTFSVQGCNGQTCGAWSDAVILTVDAATTATNPQSGTVLGVVTECLNLSSSMVSLESTDSSTGGEVTKIQNFLVAKGLLSGSATGYFGAKTRDAVIAYQTQKGISATGNVGPVTKEAINKDSCSQ
jgi:hypothetical protein